MVPNISKTGTSFAGAAAYHLHDKREEGEETRTTSERVEWAETRNMFTNDADMGFKVMAATAMDQDRLKAEAGIKNTGRKSAQSVYSYSLGWHVDETGKIDKAEMMKAVDGSLKSIGAQDHQAVIIAHNDEAHPHVHVIVNRVHPETGVMLNRNNDVPKINDWALAYRKERGEEQKYCPNRQKRADAIEQKKSGQDVEYVSGDHVPYNIYKAFEGVANDNNTRQVKQDQKTKDAGLAAYGEKMHLRHGHEKEALNLNHKANIKEIKQRYGEQLKNAPKEIKEIFRPAWRELFKQQWKESKDFEKREAHLSGKIKNTIDAVVSSRKLNPDSSKGAVSSGFNFMMSKEARLKALDKSHVAQRRELGREEKGQRAQLVNDLKERRERDIKHARGVYKSDRGVLNDRQAAEKADLSRKWNRRNEERKTALKDIDRTENIKHKAKQTQDKAQQRTSGTKSDKTDDKTKTKLNERQKAFLRAAKGRRERKRSRSRNKKV